MMAQTSLCQFPLSDEAKLWRAIENTLLPSKNIAFQELVREHDLRPSDLLLVGYADKNAFIQEFYILRSPAPIYRADPSGIEVLAKQEAPNELVVDLISIALQASFQNGCFKSRYLENMIPLYDLTQWRESRGPVDLRFP